MKIKYIGKGSYYHHPFLFNRDKNTHEVTEEIGTILLGQPKLFEKMAEPKKETKKEKEEVLEDTKVEDVKESKEETEDEKKKGSKK